MQIFAFEYCHCVYESGFSIVSLHFTKKSAYKAMIKHKNELWYADRFYNDWQDAADIGMMERWKIKTYEVQE